MQPACTFDKKKKKKEKEKKFAQTQLSEEKRSLICDDRRGLRGETGVDVVAQLRYQQQAGRVDEADRHQRRLDRHDEGSRPDGVLGAQGDLLYSTSFPPAPLRLGVPARRTEAEAGAQVPRCPVQQGVYREEARLDLERQATAGAPGIPTGQGLQTKCQVSKSIAVCLRVRKQEAGDCNSVHRSMSRLGTV